MENVDLEKIKQDKTIQELLEFGIINIDKPANYTSFQTAEIAGKMLKELGVRKFSHFGTLDPKVTGVLPVALNRACKLTSWFMKKNKTYVGIFKVHKKISEDKLKEEMKKFIGKIIQMPPVKSRVKRQEREREVFSWEILEYDRENKEVLFSCEVEAGTYVRKLISDLGLIIGGSHMTELRRTKAGIFSENDKNFVNLYELEKIKNSEKSKDFLTHKNSSEFLDNLEELRKIIIPAEVICKILPYFEVKEEIVKELLTGKPLFKKDLNEELKLKENDNFCLFFGNKFIGVYRKVQENGIIARAEWVRN